MKVAIALVALMAAATMAAPSARIQHLFTQWEAEHKDALLDTSLSKSMEDRLAAFEQNLKFIHAQNKKFAAGESSWEAGLNQFSDLTNAEFRSIIHNPINRTSFDVEYLTPSNADSVDWRTKGAVTPVKNQGQCGSCWSFSTTGSTEGAHAIATGKLISLSEQQLCDCSRSFGNQGCNGGLMDNAFKYIEQNGGLDLESDYPYTARDGSCNKEKEGKKYAPITGYKDVAHNNDDQLQAAVELGPVSIAIEADKPAFQSYKSGVFDDAGCGTQLDHGVLIVGFGADLGKKYWIVKNSWGASWGDSGYIKIARESGAGICGINMQPSYPKASASVAAPAVAEYEKPPCAAGEEAIQITGISGDFCSPKCSIIKKCPDAPSGSTAKPECVLEAQGSSKPTNCALICVPGSGSGGCPTGASCQAIQGTGICTYPSA